ncbi:AMP-binding protein [Amycolatopsis nigrescens]|uniref:AMP-binding protein n=1 Tax=Amycolatopsis nigrescens TaxID=381445 RepID=UPI000362188D|nr:AMP-binding protein [Amycolatopsis nigrescens]
MESFLRELIGHGDQDAVWLKAQQDITYRALGRQVDELAHTFRAHRIDGGHAVLVDARTHFTALCAVFALWAVDAQVVLSAHGLDPHEVARANGARYRLSFGVCRDASLAGTEVVVRPQAMPLGPRSADCLVVLERDGGRRSWSAAELLAELRERTRHVPSPRQESFLDAGGAHTAAGVFVDTVLTCTYRGGCLRTPHHQLTPIGV